MWYSRPAKQTPSRQMALCSGVTLKISVLLSSSHIRSWETEVGDNPLAGNLVLDTRQGHSQWLGYMPGASTTSIASIARSPGSSMLPF